MLLSICMGLVSAGPLTPIYLFPPLYLITTIPPSHFSSLYCFPTANCVVNSFNRPQTSYRRLCLTCSCCSCVLFRCRSWCQSVISHKLFDHVVLVFIFLNCITIALERPDIHPDSSVRHAQTQTIKPRCFPHVYSTCFPEISTELLLLFLQFVLAAWKMMLSCHLLQQWLVKLFTVTLSYNV